MAKITVIGAGAFGTSLAIHCAKLEHEVRLWVFEGDLAERINQTHENEIYLPGAQIPDSILATSDYEQAGSGAEMVLFATPTKFLRTISSQASSFISGDSIVTVVSKGIEHDSLLLMNEVLAQTLPHIPPANIVPISGPSFAKEVAEGLPTDVVAASAGFLAARKVQPMLHSPLFRVYTSDDPVGVELGGALKNVIAIAAGVCDEYGLGHNARAALITRGLTEITRLGMAKGANPITFLGLAGLGDLILTCTGDLSRNRTLGKRIARGEKPEEILAAQVAVAEGFYAAKSAYQLGKKLNVDTPIIDQVYAVLYENKTLSDASRELMSREYKNEFKGIIHS